MESCNPLGRRQVLLDLGLLKEATYVCNTAEGTGFDHATTEDMLRSTDRYIGRAAKIAEQGYRSGALRNSAFEEKHLEKEATQKEAKVTHSQQR